MIYFIQDSRTYSIKIGFTDGDPKTRLSALQTGNPGELIILAAVPGDRSDEASLHRRFAESRVAGEWFHPSPVIVTWIIERVSFESRGGWDESPPPVAVVAEQPPPNLLEIARRHLSRLKLGSIVEHELYGRGAVTDVRENDRRGGPDGTVKVRFPAHGEKCFVTNPPCLTLIK